MSTTAEADAACVTLLDTMTTPVALDAGVNLFLGPILDDDHSSRPTRAVFVELMREQSTRFCGTSSDWRESWVQISTRADLSDYDGNQALVRAIRDAFLAPSVDGYTSVSVDSGPYLARIDASNRTVWILTVRLTRAT